MDEQSWYEKLARSGWLGTKAQVSAEYGHPVWSSKPDDDDTYGQALKNYQKKAQTSEGSEG